MSQDRPLAPDALAALRARFETQARTAQTYYSLMHEVRRVLGSDEAASAWMEAPLAAFDGKTPAALVAEGREAEVIKQVGAAKAGAPRG